MEISLRVRRKIAIMLVATGISSFAVFMLIGHFFALVFWPVFLVGAAISGFLGLRLIRRNTKTTPSPVQSVIIFCAMPVIGFIFFWFIVQFVFLLLWAFNIH